VLFSGIPTNTTFKSVHDAAMDEKVIDDAELPKVVVEIGS
jgi:hypothetical protein